MSTIYDNAVCPNCGVKTADMETDTKSGHTIITCNVCGFYSEHREDVCPECTAGLSFDTIEDNGVLDPKGNFLVHYKTTCMSENCNYEGYAIYKMQFVCHNDTMPE